MGDIANTKARHRSPSYPSIDLEHAILLARKFFDHAMHAVVPVASAAAYWGFKPASSGWRLAMAALKQYGLIESVGGKKSGEVKLSDLARKIILDACEDSPERRQAIKDAALNPEIYKELWLHWSGNRPDAATFRTYLTLNKGFNQNSVAGFIADFDKTIAFANLDASDIIRAAGAAARITERDSFEEDETEDEDGGTDETEKRRPRRRPMQAGMKEDVFTLEEGPVTLQYPERLSQESFEDLESWLQLIIRKAKRSIRSDLEADE